MSANEMTAKIKELKSLQALIEEAEAESKEKLYHDGSWYIDYVRIRFRAVKY